MNFIFDFDGTLLDTKTCMKEALEHTLLYYGFSEIDEALLALYLTHPYMLFENQFFLGFSEKKISKFLERYRFNFIRLRKRNAVLFPDTKKTLTLLKDSGSKLFLVSSSNTFETQEKLEQVGLGDFFEGIIATDSLRVFKPHANLIHHLVREFNLNKNELMMVGDSVNDIRMAQSAGIMSCAIVSGIDTKEILMIENPNVFLEALRDLTSFI